MAAAWICAAVLLVVHAQTVNEYLTIAGQLGLRGQPEATTPLTQSYPAFAADAQTWVRHALALLEGTDIRLRHTTIDNAPDGREVHWNSAWAWFIAGAGWIDHWLTGTPLTRSVERMTIWLNPATLWVLTLVISAWAARRGGALVGVIVVLAMVGHNRVFEGFFPSYVDHHGLLTTAVFGMVLGAVFMGAGWWHPTGAKSGLLPTSVEQARAGAIFSALSGAFGLWVSAASVIPPIVIVGLMGLLTVLIQGRKSAAEGATFAPQLWRLWGRVGGAASLAFYLLEYFPNHLGLRLEANHPLHALAWFGGGELIALLAAAWLAKPGERRPGVGSFVLPVVAVSLAPLAILIGGARVFSVFDPFLAELHRTHIQEFLPLWRTISGTGWKTFFNVIGLENVALVAGIIVLCISRRRAPVLLWFATLSALAFTTMAWSQSRWLLNASGSQIALLIVLAGFFLANHRLAVRWTAIMAVAGILFAVPAISRITAGRSDVQTRRVAPKDANAALFRDVAAVLRASQPQGDIVLLTSPNSSTGVGYYGRFKTLGTLYWENAAGLKAAAEILSAKTPEEAAKLIRLHQVTHIAMISEENFIGPYYQLLHPGATGEDVKKSFGYQLLIDRVVPVWLQMVPYKAPDDLAVLNVSALLFKVAFDQSPADALYHVALAKITLGLLPEAERDLDQLTAQVPNAMQPWLRKGELLFARHDWPAAATAMLRAVATAPLAQRPALYATLAGNFYRQQQPAQAVRFYRAALADGFEPVNAGYLAWVLATSKNDSLRNGVEAEALAKRALATDPKSLTLMNALAAAWAEQGRFEEAVALADRTLAQARQQKEAAVERVTTERLAVYKANQPWRE